MRNINNSNINYITEKDFNIVPPGVYTWDGDLPQSFFKKFPDTETQNRANVYLTNSKLYNNDLNEVFNYLFDYSDYFRDILSNLPINTTIAKLPDFKTITDIWVSLFSTKPSITANSPELTKQITEMINNTSYQQKQNDIIKDTFFICGNTVEVILEDGSFNYPTKCWIPFVNKEMPSKIEVNALFNIGKLDGKRICEFSLYFADGRYEKRVYSYNKKCLGIEVVDREYQQFSTNPVVVFKGNSKDTYPFGVDSYRYWESSISACIQTYETLLRLGKRLEEIIRLIPEGATIVDPRTGVTVYPNLGAVAYDSSKKDAPKIEYYTPDVDINGAKEAYHQSLLRLSRDTYLPYALFDTESLGQNTSAKALRTSMFLSMAMAKKMATEIKPQLKHYIYLLCLTNGIDLNENDFDISLDTAFVKDDDELYDIISKRIGNKETMTQAQAISVLDGVSLEIAEGIVNQINNNNNLNIKRINPSITDKKDINFGTLDIQGKNDEKIENTTTNVIREYPLGGENIGRKV